MKKTFDEVVLFARTGLNPRQNFKLGQGKNKYITIKNIKNNTLVVDDNTDVVDDDAIKLIHKRSQIKKGDILFASIGRMGDMYIIEKEPVGWDINESVFAFTLNTNIVRQKYFYYIFKVKSTLDYLASNSSGSTFKSIKMNQLKRMVFDIPSLKEQDSIITILDKVCNVIEMRKRELGSLDELIKARFVEMFGDPIKNPKGWEVVTIGDIVKEVKYGTSKPAVEGGQYPYLRMNNLTSDGHLDLNDLKYIDISEDEIEKCVVRKGDVLFNRTNSIELIGKTAVFDLPDDMVIAGYIIRVRLNERMLPEVLSQYMNLEALKDILRSMAKGAVNQANINAQELQSIKVYLPDMGLQKKFIEMKEQVDKSKVAIQAALDKSQLLFDSLMQKYFG